MSHSQDVAAIAQQLLDSLDPEQRAKLDPRRDPTCLLRPLRALGEEAYELRHDHLTDLRKAVDEILWAETRESLATLEGSPKQVEWAERIRRDALTRCAVHSINTHIAEATDDVAKKMQASLDAVLAESSASWWIDRRESHLESLAIGKHHELMAAEAVS